MDKLHKRVQELNEKIRTAIERMHIEEKQAQVGVLEEILSQPEVWNNPAYAQQQAKDLSALQAIIEPWMILFAQVSDIDELLAIEDSADIEQECEQQIAVLETTFVRLQKDMRYQGEFDQHDVIVRLSAGVGGTDAQDWTEMLERMYLRWAERSDMKATVIDVSKGEEAGIKSATIEISGPFAYGKLKGEHGVHRLVRLSPFNSDNLRQTSFALVEIMPQIDRPEEVSIDDKDLKIDVYRAGGHGGQSVNTTDSAVRVTHMPTGITVAIQNERSQLQNKETALKILRSKLIQLQIEQHAHDISELRAGESANWGSQIRNYVLHPYSLVKDTRTKHEQTDTQAVLDGEIDGFIDAFADSAYDK